jgi:eukaryotic-like serine/threonine-protein kinase
VAETVAPGRVLGGRYRLDHELARGGMATVWVAEDPLLSRRVAIKILHPQLAIDASLRTRFRHEAVAAAKLSHPAIVATYDTGDDDGVAYIVMQLVEGPTLRRMLDLRGPLPVDEAADITRQVAEALDHAHRHGLVHRDIKPANVLVPPDGQVKVTDFGIAKAAGDEDLTRTGSVIGTARYLAPEQVNGGVVDGRADVYALGLLLYEMLTGTLPFTGDSEIATAAARLTTDPEPVRARRADVPPALEAVVSHTLAREPSQRFPSARALRDALDPMLEVTPPSTAAVMAPGPDQTAQAPRAPAPPAPPPPTRGARPRPASRPRRSGMGWAWLLVVLLLLVAAAAVTYLVIDSRDNEGGGGGGETPATPIALVSATDFDPLGDGGESGGSVGNAIDGNPATAWETEQYQAPQQEFGGNKDGVGLFVELDAVHDIDDVAVTTDESGWSADVYVADEPATDLAGWGQARGSTSDAGTTADIPLDSGTRGRYVLLWLTRLPSSGKLHVNEIQIA